MCSLTSKSFNYSECFLYKNVKQESTGEKEPTSLPHMSQALTIIHLVHFFFFPVWSLKLLLIFLCLRTCQYASLCYTRYKSIQYFRRWEKIYTTLSNLSSNIFSVKYSRNEYSNFMQKVHNLIWRNSPTSHFVSSTTSGSSTTLQGTSTATAL